MTSEYFLIPEFTTPTSIWKMKGRKCATSLEAHRLHQTISTQTKNHLSRTLPIWGLSVMGGPPTMIGMARMSAKGATYSIYRVIMLKSRIFL